MRPILTCVVLFGVMLLAFACGDQGSTAVGGGDSPTDAYKKLYEAVKSKNIDAIKAQLTKKTIDFGTMVGEKNKNPEIFKNGFTATTFSETLPTIRDERINGQMGAVEVWNSRDSKWEDLPYMLEDGKWKLAVGEVFAGTYQSPGPGLDQKEKQAANAQTNNNLPIATVNTNTNKIPVVNAMPPEMLQDKKAK